MDLSTIKIKKPANIQCIIGQGNFSLKTAKDLAEAILKAAPEIQFGLAMNEASDKIVRVEGNNKDLKNLSSKGRTLTIIR